MSELTCSHCEEEGTHAEWCESAQMALSKRDFVSAATNGVRAAFHSYTICVETLGMSREEATEMVIDEAEESASCFAGIGSCYGGGCKHG